MLVSFVSLGKPRHTWGVRISVEEITSMGLTSIGLASIGLASSVGLACVQIHGPLS